MHVCSVFPSPIQNLRLLEEVLHDLPPLEGVFLHWHTHGVTSTTAGISSLFARRKQLLGPTTLSGASVQLLYECATESLWRRSSPWQDVPCPWDSRPLHARLLRHAASLRSAKTQALLPPGVLVQKTVSRTLVSTQIFYTGAGLHRITREHLRAVSAGLELPRWSVTQNSINASISNPVETCAMQPGMVSPFLHPTLHTAFGALVILPWPEQWEAYGREVAISLSLWESLLLPLRCLRPLIHSYARKAYPDVPIIELESEDMLYAQRR
jgi:hypothetical protein